MGLGLSKDIVICFIVAILYAYGSKSFLNGCILFIVYLFLRTIYLYLTTPSKR